MNQLSKEEAHNRAIIRYIKRMIVMTSKELPFQFWINIPASLLHCLSFIFILYAGENFFEMVTVISIGESSLTIMKALLLYGFAYIFNQVINGVHNYMYSIRSTKLIGIFRDIVHKKASTIAPLNYEDPIFLDKLDKAKKGTSISIFASDLVVVLFTFYVPYFIFMTIYLGSKSMILTSALLLIFIPVIAGQMIRMKLFKTKEDRVAPLRREMEAREREIYDRQFFKETRLLGAVTFLKELFYKVTEQVNRENWKAERKSMIQMLLLNSLSILGYLCILGLLVYLCLKGEITIGSFVAIFSSLSTMFNIAHQIVSTHIGSIAQDAASIQNLIEFLDMTENTGTEADFDATTDIKLENVSFKYPTADVEVLKELNLTVRLGEVLAIVGDNGAGKSTLVKLLSGIYQPTKGKVIIGGMDTAKTKPESIYQGISAVYQKYKCYQMTLKDNIMISDAKVPAEEQTKQLERAICEAELEVSENVFQAGVDTMLSREFDGIDVSGGQWQRIAIARGLYRGSEIMILDEPTAAIDPIEETRLYQQFAAISRDKTTIIVTHRLGSTRIADRIVVLKEGMIDDIGTYEELISKDGLYAHMYRAQSIWYQK